MESTVMSSSSQAGISIDSCTVRWMKTVKRFLLGETMGLKRTALVMIGGSILGYLIYSKLKDKSRICKIVLISNLQQWKDYGGEFLSACQKSRILGLDCEWITSESGRNKVALLQLAPNDTLVFLFRLNLMEVPEEILEILSDMNIVKLGVAVKDDADKLAHDFGVKVNSSLDLRYLVSHLDIDDQSLAGITKELTCLSMSKDNLIRVSNWEAEKLSESQRLYAANDALAPIMCVYALVGNLFAPLTYHKLLSKYHLFIGIPYRAPKKNKSKSSLTDSRTKATEPDSPTESKAEAPITESKAKSVESKAIRKDQQLYKNAIMQAPDGEVLCSTDKVKTDWYLKMNLATLVSEEPFTIRLKFEPRCRAILGGEYYVDEKLNICVVCGSEKDLLKKNVVPMEYRKLFPALMKAHTSHDSVLICVTCQQRSVAADSRLRQTLDEKCPFTGEVPNFQEIKRAARALETSWAKLPSERREAFIGILEAHYGRRLDDEMLNEAANMDSRVWMQESGANHARRVIDKYVESEGLFALEKLWRQHFLDSMQPQHLPDKWTILHNHDAVLMKVATGRDIGDYDIEEFLRILGVSWNQMAELVKCIVEEGLVEADRIVINEILAEKGFLSDYRPNSNGGHLSK